jgi:hypothetical protein
VNDALTLPPGYHLYPGQCPVCARSLVIVDYVEGLPIYACPGRCEEAKP